MLIMAVLLQLEWFHANGGILWLQLIMAVLLQLEWFHANGGILWLQ